VILRLCQTKSEALAQAGTAVGWAFCAAALFFLFMEQGVVHWSGLLSNGGSVEKAQQMANHSDPRTTKLYDRRRDEVSLDEVERILI